MNGKISWGWLFLLAALAFPAVLFWNWWRTVNVHSPASAQRGVFAPAVSSTAASYPAVPVPASAPTPGPSVFTTRASSSAAVSVLNRSSEAASGSVSVSLKPAAPVVVPTAALAPGISSATSTAAASDDAIFHPKTDRDPLLSPLEKKMMEERERERAKAREERKHPASARGVARRPSEPPIETRIQVMAVVRLDRPGAQPTATINGIDVRQGDVLEGLGVKVVKIDVHSVTFEYHKKRFVKYLR